MQCYRRIGDGSDADSSRETSSDYISDSGAERGFNNVVTHDFWAGSTLKIQRSLVGSES